MLKSCHQCSAAFEVSDSDLKFYDDASPIIGDTKFSIPPPALCPDCRLLRRMAMRNSSKLYTRKSDMSGKQIVSIYAPEKPHKVYDQEEWWSDAWDAITYGREYNSGKTLTEQLAALSLVVPRASLNTVNAENSYYTNHTLNCKNCYLLFGGGNDEDCYYGNYVAGSKNVVDALCVYHSERGYEGTSSDHCYNCIQFINSRNCTDCLFIDDCQSCTNCMLCFGLQRKENCYLNKDIGKEGMEKKKKELFPLTHEKLTKLRAEFDAFKASLPHRYAHSFGSEDCTGDGIFNSKNCQNCFDVSDCEDCKHVFFTPKGLHSHDCSFTAPDGLQWSYEACSTVGIQSAIATFMVWYGDNVYYSLHCHSCRDCFACVGLKNKRYCILNKEYSKEDYEKLVPQIVAEMQKSGEWGEYLDPSLSAFSYNETIAHEYFPLTPEQAKKRGYGWRDIPEDVPTAKKTIPAERLPATIDQIPDDVLDWAIVCEATKRPFKIIEQELAYYRDLKLPIPHLHPEERHRLRMERRGPRKLWTRKCDKCGQQMETIYGADRPETVYCEKCYLETIY